MERRPDRPVPDQHDELTAAPPGVWRLAAGHMPAWRGWDGQYVVYDDLSGDTHLLGEAAFALLLALAGGARGEAQLARADGGAALLAELEALGLIEFIPC